MFLLAYCVLINRVRVEAQFKPTLRGGVPMNLLRNRELKFVCVVLKWQCSLIQITRKKSSLASLLNHSLKETFNLMFKDSNFDGIAEETNGYAQKEMDPAWCKTDAEEVKAFFTLNILLGIKQRYPVKSPTVQLANANLLTYKIKWRRQRVGLQSSTNYY